jgi:hypothetical protein
MDLVKLFRILETLYEGGVEVHKSGRLIELLQSVSKR